jgi:hypothetical protein
VPQLQQGGRDLASALRVARQLVLERLAVLDVEEAAPLDTVTHTMTIWPKPRWKSRWRRPWPKPTNATACRWTRTASAWISGSSAWASSARAS